MRRPRVLVRFWGRKPSDIVRVYLDSPGTVVDPFGGSGSFVLAALELGKRVVYSDINPYAWLVAHVTIAGADPEEFLSTALQVLDRASRAWIYASSAKLHNDYLYYYNGRPFLKRRNFDRVSEFFSPENRMKLRAILKSIDAIEASPRTKLALYLAFCTALYPSSYMNRCGAGSWGVPSYWAPKNSCPEDALKAFEKAIYRFYNFLKTAKFYTVCYTETCNADARLLIKNALTLKYEDGWTLVTDPPHVNEVQYAELSYFYWVWLRSSGFPELVKRLIGKRPRLYMSKEIIVNEARGKNINTYMNKIALFMRRTRRLRKKVLVLHEERENILKKLIELAQSIWGKTRVESIHIANHRSVGPRGSEKYTIIYSET